MTNISNSEIVSKAASASLLIAWLFLISGGVLILTGAFDLHIILWRIYVGAGAIGFSALSLGLYAILKALEPITEASEAYLDTFIEDNE